MAWIWHQHPTHSTPTSSKSQILSIWYNRNAIMTIFNNQGQCWQMQYNNKISFNVQKNTSINRYLEQKTLCIIIYIQSESEIWMYKRLSALPVFINAYGQLISKVYICIYVNILWIPYLIDLFWLLGTGPEDMKAKNSTGIRLLLGAHILYQTEQWEV